MVKGQIAVSSAAPTPPGQARIQPAGIRGLRSQNRAVGVQGLPLLQAGLQPVTLLAAQMAGFPRMGIETRNLENRLGTVLATKTLQHRELALHQIRGQSLNHLLEGNMGCGQEGVEPPVLVG